MLNRPKKIIYQVSFLFCYWKFPTQAFFKTEQEGSGNQHFAESAKKFLRIINFIKIQFEKAEKNKHNS